VGAFFIAKNIFKLTSTYAKEQLAKTLVSTTGANMKKILAKIFCGLESCSLE